MIVLEPVDAAGTQPKSKAKAAKKKTYALTPTPAYGANAHGVWLPAGDYTLVGVKSRDDSPYQVVTVRAGEITDLGAWLRVPLGGYEVADIAIQHPESAAELAAAVRALADKLETQTPIVWAPTAPPKSVNVGGTGSTNLGLVADLIMSYNNKVNKPPLNKLLREAPTVQEMWRLARFTMKPQTDEGAVDDQGNLYYGANLGQLRVRSPTGEWNNIDTGTLESITAVEAEGATLVAGTGLGSIYVSDDRGANWKRIGALQPGDGVIDIDHVGQRWFVVGARYTLLPPNPQGLASARTIHEVRLYSASSRSLGDLAVLREIARPNAVTWAGAPETWSGQVSGSNYYIGNLESLLKIDVGTLAVTTINTPQKVAGFNLSGSAPAITVFLPAGLGSKVNYSKDGGATWVEYKRPSISFYDVLIDEAAHATASRWNIGMWKATLEFVEWDAKASAWKLSYTTPPGCAQVLRDADRHQSYCVTTGASILVRDGTSWKAEFAVE